MDADDGSGAPVTPEVKPKVRGAMASHGIFLVCLFLFTDTRCCRAAALEHIDQKHKTR